MVDSHKDNPLRSNSSLAPGLLLGPLVLQDLWAPSYPHNIPVCQNYEGAAGQAAQGSSSVGVPDQVLHTWLEYRILHRSCNI